ncbi:hypothetical protein CSPHI_04900 [Corynebacterium sphenisci DSM 44792]|uniref:Uncharacterized protein n=1 Tax=Corynebacterium sphenisci DSM 44792 TaxID=1437874 RepID=A0A1L7CX89_9CORY|nr:hypothetical protein [Corynebacterium sphenisci]APT90486.1 hypothetical protein CSPHI_04900 [Corynebacterium sphenisci DSM 44792]
MTAHNALGCALGAIAATGVAMLILLLAALTITGLPGRHTTPPAAPGRPPVATADCPPSPSADHGPGDTPCPTTTP